MKVFLKLLIVLDAEELMRKLEREEEKAAMQDPEKPVFSYSFLHKLLALSLVYCEFSYWYPLLCKRKL